MVFVLLMLALLVVTTISPRMTQPGRSWWVAGSWKNSILEVWPALLCAMILRYEEKFRKLFFSRRADHPWEVRMATLAKIIDDLRTSSIAKDKMAAIRSEILKCVISAIAEIVNRPAESLCANVLSFEDAGANKLMVIARSDPKRALYKKYDCNDGFLPWTSIKTASILVEHNYREREGLGKRDYRSIVAVPITKEGKAFGSLAVDCGASFAFFGYKKQIAFQLRPYISLLALTFSKSDSTIECLFRNRPSPMKFGVYHDLPRSSAKGTRKRRIDRNANRRDSPEAQWPVCFARIDETWQNYS